MNGGFSIIALDVWRLILAVVFGVARVVPWRRLRITINLSGLLLVAIRLEHAGAPFQEPPFLKGRFGQD